MPDVVHIPDYEIIRHKRNDFATYGRWYDARGEQRWVSIERPWVDLDGNLRRDRQLSCFVPGLYEMFVREAGTGKRDYDLWEFLQVPDVDNAQVHIANFPWDLNGCIGIGTAFGDVEWKKASKVVDGYTITQGKKYPGVTGSSTAHDAWMKDTLALCARTGRSRIWVQVTDQLAA